MHQVSVTLRATPKPFNDPENLVESAVRSMLDHPIHAINQRETLVSQATDVLQHEHDAIMMAIKILDQISDEARHGNTTSTDVPQFLGFLREFYDTIHTGQVEERTRVVTGKDLAKREDIVD